MTLISIQNKKTFRTFYTICSINIQEDYLFKSNLIKSPFIWAKCEVPVLW